MKVDRFGFVTPAEIRLNQDKYVHQIPIFTKIDFVKVQLLIEKYAVENFNVRI